MRFIPALSYGRIVPLLTNMLIQWSQNSVNLIQEVDMDKGISGTLEKAERTACGNITPLRGRVDQDGL